MKFYVKVYATGTKTADKLALQGESEELDTNKIAKLAKDKGIKVEEAISQVLDGLSNKYIEDKNMQLGKDNGISELWFYGKNQKYDVFGKKGLKYRKGCKQRDFIKEIISDFKIDKPSKTYINKIKSRLGSMLREDARKEIWRTSGREYIKLFKPEDRHKLSSTRLRTQYGFSKSDIIKIKKGELPDVS